jgi:hypothetical protein
MATRIARTRITAGRAPSHPEVCFVAVRGLFDEIETACGEHFGRRSAELLAVGNNQDPVGHLTHSWLAAGSAAIR